MAAKMILKFQGRIEGVYVRTGPALKKYHKLYSECPKDPISLEDEQGRVLFCNNIKIKI